MPADPASQHVSYFARRIDVTNPYALADFAASLTTADAKDLQVRAVVCTWMLLLFYAIPAARCAPCLVLSDGTRVS